MEGVQALFEVFMCCQEADHNTTAEPVTRAITNVKQQEEKQARYRPTSASPTWGQDNTVITNLDEKPMPGECEDMQQEATKPAEAEQAVPEGGTFSLPLAKLGPIPMGIEVDCIDHVSAVISKIGSGLVQEWNEAHPARRVEVYDRIINIDGTGGGINDMIELMHKDTFTKRLFYVKKARFVNVEVNKGTGSIGLALNFTPSVGGIGLLIAEVKDGPILDWNNQNHGERSVKVNDRIIEVNGVKNEPQEILEMLRSAQAIQLKILAC
eukprot:TRINITY_DN37453_c0_g1_i1.p1 TRINITY_DN37453_c0_g1~~TRINITY_DN37453_c0_g1_i1.p1  ORF type:complete len:267 (-),score=64.80 TRINITY_DN37453_c0_g1_i1:60-860(-)